MSPAAPARAGDRVVLVRCHGRQYVVEWKRDEWRCKTCGSRGQSEVTLVLPEPGFEPGSDRLPL